MKTIALLLAAAAAVPGIASAATVVPMSATASSSYPGYEAGFAIDAAPDTDWAANMTGAGSTLNLDLGGRYVLSSASVTDRVTSGGPNGAFFGGLFDYTTQFSLAYFTDATFTTQVGSTQVFNRPTPTSTSTEADFTFDAPLTGGQKVEFVQYQVLATDGVNPGLANISFTGSVPEPATWAMMVLGFGMVGFGLRARRKQTARVTYA